MQAFYFDVGGVLIPDKFAPSNAINVLRELGRRHRFDPELACDAYARLQPSLDLGATSLADLCQAMGIAQESFEREWLAIHPVDQQTLSLINELVARGHAVGLATNFCRRLLNLLIQNTDGLSRLAVCCSSDIGVAKPSVEFFDLAAKLIHSRDVVFVDDRAVNIDAAQRCGWTVIQAVNGWRQRFESTYLADRANA